MTPATLDTGNELLDAIHEATQTHCVGDRVLRAITAYRDSVAREARDAAEAKVAAIFDRLLAEVRR